jgi:DNA repair exonuclease SbcCD ATPase subunit
MKIIKFTAENVKRLKAVEITPDGTVQVVAGRNAQGKSSVLDAIWLALGGGPAARATARPIRDGEETASVTLDLGDLIVTRSWKGERTTLTVKGADGAKHSSPQAVLDGLVGRLSFDPLEFTRRTSAEQRDALLSLVDLPFDPATLDAERARAYDVRTEIGRQQKAIGKVHTPEGSLPLAEHSATDLFAEIQTARIAKQTELDQRAGIEAITAEIEGKTARIAELTGDVASRTEALEAAIAALTVAPKGQVERLEVRMAGIEVANEAIRDSNRNLEQFTASEALHGRYEALTAEIDGLDRKKAEGLAAAVFPVDGLGFDEGGVTYQGIPFSQASSAEQIQVSLAMAMSLNPTLKVIRIMDGSLLDSDSLALISTAAADADYQVWIERVGGGGEGAVVIEDGEVEQALTLDGAA